MLLEIALEKVLTQQSLKLVSLQLFQVWSVDAMQSLKLLWYSVRVPDAIVSCVTAPKGVGA